MLLVLQIAFHDWCLLSVVTVVTRNDALLISGGIMAAGGNCPGKF